jgi:hypothetical protein
MQHHQEQSALMRRFNATFTDHPASVGETYGQHLRFALRFSGLLLTASIAAFIHALVPSMFETTGSRILRRLHSDLERRH